ncbi:MAG: hypothetical protein ACI92E_001541, partial [Oceanicoccus sp.]
MLILATLAFIQTVIKVDCTVYVKHCTAFIATKLCTWFEYFTSSNRSLGELTT